MTGSAEWISSFFCLRARVRDLRVWGYKNGGYFFFVSVTLLWLSSSFSFLAHARGAVFPFYRFLCLFDDISTEKEKRESSVLSASIRCRRASVAKRRNETF